MHVPVRIAHPRGLVSTAMNFGFVSGHADGTIKDFSMVISKTFIAFEPRFFYSLAALQASLPTRGGPDFDPLDIQSSQVLEFSG